MSTSDRILLFLHIGFAIFTLGPLTAATMSTPRYIRKRNVVVVRYLHRTTQIYGIGTLGIFLIGLGLAKGDLAEVWLTVSMTLFVVALVLLLIVERDQRKAVHLLEVAAAEAVPAPVAARPAATEKAGEAKEGGVEAEGGAAEAGAPAAGATAEPAAATGEIAQVERGRLAAMSGVVALIWLVILVLMVWNG
ncbi:hypothetical protein [Actinomadura citrea]|uniref:Putative membrane protein n=1 Tax=Actinomadura citrea TaxID=46158 RepID=A0A7Y9G7B4_9ACTN|nr:hypothetical protein [Actinomadura citrea]NYE11329.1 putative membrane protein [Actinomadura citrea]GGT77089.1 hypothetical protein GCM10010177_39160 [Actinomadura citrea]